MKRLLLITIVLLLGFSSKALADEFVVKSFVLDPSDISARKYERRDINDDKCAIIKIRTDIEGIKFDPRLGAEGSVDFKNGEYWLYVSPGEKVIKIIKSGFISFDYVIETKIESSNVYKMELTGSDRFTIRVNTDPESVDFMLDDKSYKTNTAVQDIAPGTHIIKIEAPNFESILDTIYVSKTTLFWDYQLKALKRVLVKFASNPPGAILLVDGAPIGTTPKDYFTLTGKHHLAVSLDKYITVDTLITLVDGKNDFNFNMVKNASYVTVYKYPQEAVVQINGRPLEAATEQEIGAEQQTISVTCENYYPFDTTFVAEKGKKYTFTASLVRHSGNMMILANPADASFELIKGEDDIVLSWQGSNTLENIATDTYNIRAFKKGYKEQLRPIIIKNEQTHEFEFILDQLSVQKGSKIVALTLSAIIPGSGQLYAGQKRGWFYMLGVGGGIGGVLYGQSKVDEYLAAVQQYQDAQNIIQLDAAKAEMERTHPGAVSGAQIRTYSLMAAGGIYALNVLDAILFGKKKVVKKDKTASFIAYPVNNTVAMGVNFTFQSKR